MADPIVYVDVSEIREGKLKEVKAAQADLARFAEENEPQLISYAFYVDEEGRRQTVVAVHPDSASLGFHMEIADELFRRFAGLIELSSIDVYGEVSDGVVAQLRSKAEMLGTGRVNTHDKQAGFARFSRGPDPSGPQR